MTVKAKVSIQTPKRLYAPGELVPVSREDGETLIENGNAILIDEDDPDSGPDPAEAPPTAKRKASK